MVTGNVHAYIADSEHSNMRNPLFRAVQTINSMPFNLFCTDASL